MTEVNELWLIHWQSYNVTDLFEWLKEDGLNHSLVSVLHKLCIFTSNAVSCVNSSSCAL